MLTCYERSMSVKIGLLSLLTGLLILSTPLAAHRYPLQFPASHTNRSGLDQGLHADSREMLLGSILDARHTCEEIRQAAQQLEVTVNIVHHDRAKAFFHCASMQNSLGRLHQQLSNLARAMPSGTPESDHLSLIQDQMHSLNFQMDFLKGEMARPFPSRERLQSYCQAIQVLMGQYLSHLGAINRMITSPSQRP